VRTSIQRRRPVALHMVKPEDNVCSEQSCRRRRGLVRQRLKLKRVPCVPACAREASELDREKEKGYTLVRRNSPPPGPCRHPPWCGVVTECIWTQQFSCGFTFS
jgi:hypothetical protein